jgi:hypothetical protein
MPKIHIAPDGSVALDVGTIKRIGIKNIGDLKTYVKSRVGDRVMHIFEFEDGGTCEVTYLTSGTLELFTGQAIETEADDDGNIIIGQIQQSTHGGSN